jgi:uncharacterized protein Yka (UPF0111/DUF47 family)
MTPVRLPWFLRSQPDVVELLRAQVRSTEASLRAFAAWSEGGDGAAAAAVRVHEHEGDDARRALVDALREVLSAPLDQEDIYTVSDRLDLVQNSTKNVVRQAQAADWEPDAQAARMAGCALDAIEHLVRAFDALPDDQTRASEHADAAIKATRGLQKAYRQAVAELAVSTEPAGRVVLTAEIYRRYDGLGDAVVGVCHRVWFSVLKEA